MVPSELLRKVSAVLERLNIRYFVTGSTATIFFGEPRFTNDIDIVADLTAGQIGDFCNQFSKDDFYISEIAANDAVRLKTQFNLIHPSSGLKVDIIVPPDTSFNKSRFFRSRRINVGNELEAYFTSPEDAILKKMEYYREGGSEKHLRDIAGVLKTNGAKIDFDYINRWVEPLGLTDIWLQIQKRIGR